jgi:two-component system OmpR family response regulator
MAESLLLIVDDDAETRALIAAFLGQHGFLTRTTGGAAEARQAMAAARPALIVLDVMMPGEDGLSLLRSLDAGSRPPVIIHSALGDDVDRIVGLEVGADDYVAKPCNPRELLARVRAILRRSGVAPSAGTRLRFAGFALDPEARLLDGPAGPVALTDGEFRLLLAFVEAPRRVLTRDYLIERVGGAEAEQFDRAIDVALSRLRKKLGDDGALIRTVRGEGYMLTTEVHRG